MKFDVVISNPPFRVKEDGWINHVEKHLRLLDEDSYYVLVCPATTSRKIIRDICKRFDTIKIEKIDNLDILDNIDTEVYYYIWKK